MREDFRRLQRAQPRARREVAPPAEAEQEAGGEGDREQAQVIAVPERGQEFGLAGRNIRVAAMIGFFAVVPLSVAAMAVTMASICCWELRLRFWADCRLRRSPVTTIASSSPST